jgi:hypothetical protein
VQEEGASQREPSLTSNDFEPSKARMVCLPGEMLQMQT